jgi:crotonobetainyl-CoA:carnitine CoA-transferase CaiB-like acyl-CoA transferase
MSGRPLEGIRVIDVSEHGFVPASAATLADWGADVIKVEKPAGDPLRYIMRDGLVEDCGDFNFPVEVANRNKRGISIDLKQPEGRALLDKLIAGADIFITNQLPKVLRKLALQPEDIFRVNPRIVYARGHGQGQMGPEAEAGGFDGVSYWARAGLAHMLTPPGSPSIVGSRPALGDHPSGTQLAGAICAGLVSALRTGKGVKVDLSLFAGGIWALGPDLAYTSYMGHEPRKVDQTENRAASPMVGAYATADGRFVMLVMLNDDLYWPRMCRALGREELIADERYDSQPKRIASDELRQIFRDGFASQPLAHWEERLTAEDCIYSKYASPEEVLEDPQAELNGYFPEHPTIKGARLPATPAQFDDQPIEIRRPAPGIGEHTDEILRELGVPEAEASKLRELGAIR